MDLYITERKMNERAELKAEDNIPNMLSLKDDKQRN